VLAEVRTGLITSSDGAVNPGRSSKLGAMIAADGHGRYTEAVYRGNVYHASMQAGASLGTALTATAVTLTLYNPSGSQKLLSLLGASVGLTTALAAAGTAVHVLAANVDPAAAIPTGLTAATVRNNLLGGGLGQGKAYTAATLPAAPVVVLTTQAYRIIGATPVSEYALNAYTDVGGLIVLQPNTAVTLQGIGTATSGIVSFVWEEIPL